MFEDLEYRRAEIERHQENSARLAQEFHKFTSTGQGSIEFADAAEFDVTFIEEPYVTFGCSIDLDALGELLLMDPTLNEQVPMPVVTGFVTEWDRDHRDFYTGAWVGVRVYFPPDSTPAVPVETLVDITHHFTFTAIGMKDVPLDVRN